MPARAALRLLRWCGTTLPCLGGMLALPLAGPALAQDQGRLIPNSVLPGIGTGDPRRAVDQQAAPWHALGRVQLEVGGRCTGVLIGARTVLTAAHCLVAPRSFTLVRPGSVHFLLGYRQGSHAAHARVADYAIGPGCVPAATHGSRPVTGADWAVLTLATPIDLPGRTLPLLREAPPPRTPLMLGGYQQDRPELVLADAACQVLGLARDAAGGLLLRHDCASTRGSSGGPLLARGSDGGWGVAGIASGVTVKQGGGIAVPAQSIAR